MRSEVLVLAASRGGPVQAPVTLTSLEGVKPALISGDAAMMAVAAFHAGARRVTSVRVNLAERATLDLGDLLLTSRVAGQMGAATLVKRTSRGSAWIRNAVLQATERHDADDATALAASLNAGGLVTAQAHPGKQRFAPDGRFLGGENDDSGLEGPPPDLAAWLTAAALAPRVATVALGSGDPTVVAAVSAALPHARVYAGPARSNAKSDLKSAAIDMATAAPRAQVVCNTVMLEDPQTRRAQDFPAYVLAAFAAGLWARGERAGDQRVNLPRLGFILDDEDVLELEAAGVIPVRYDHDREAHFLARL